LAIRCATVLQLFSCGVREFLRIAVVSKDRGIPTHWFPGREEGRKGGGKHHVERRTRERRRSREFRDGRIPGQAGAERGFEQQK
jgi:hypothetical protein